MSLVRDVITYLLYYETTGGGYKNKSYNDTIIVNQYSVVKRRRFSTSLLRIS